MDMPLVKLLRVQTLLNQPQMALQVLKPPTLSLHMFWSCVCSSAVQSQSVATPASIGDVSGQAAEGSDSAEPATNGTAGAYSTRTVIMHAALHHSAMCHSSLLIQAACGQASKLFVHPQSHTQTFRKLHP